MPLSAQKAQARSLIQTQQVNEARQLLLSMYKQDTQDVEIWHLLASVNGMLGKFNDSVKWSRRVIEKHPQLADAWMNLATALQHSSEQEAALDAYQHVLQLQPANVQAQLAVAELYRRAESTQAALESYRAAIRLRPQSPELHYNLGTFLQDIGDYRQAEECYLQALELKPGLLQARNNLGLVYQEQCRVEEAMRCFNDALQSNDTCNEITPGEDSPAAEVHRHRALLWLLQGNFDSGWPEYEWRHTDSMAVKRVFPSPAWEGSSLAGKSIRVCAEQGIGDEIMFASCIPDLQRQAGQVILECNPRLEKLFQRSFEGVSVLGVKPEHALTDLKNTPATDLHIPAGGLPRYLRKSLDEFPGQAFLRPDPDNVQSWQNRYARLGKGLKVGISWRGGAIARKQIKRSTRLQQWLPVFMLKGIQFINLQYGDCAPELQQLAEKNDVTVLDWPDADPLLDLDHFAAQIAALDLVISADNATVHMAGALGVPVWILQTFAPEWRWLLDREDSYWYPTVRQFRQPSIGDWETVFTAVRQALIDLYSNRVQR